MPRTQTSCPACRQPVVVDVQQLFDLAQEPQAKQKLLSNAVNMLHCPACGYQGMVSVPIVYHDPQKELLLTFYPTNLNTPLGEQEKQIGPLINRVMTSLPQEKRKAYLFQPQSMLAYQTLVEKILEADGITKEMLEEQQKRVRLLERLLTASQDDRLKLVKEDSAQFDLAFFNIFSRIMQSSLASGDEASKKELLEIQQILFENTAVGKDLYEQAKETEIALKALQEAGKDGLTREKLLAVILNSQSEGALSTIVSLTRSGLDYQFFQMLSEKIDQTADITEKKRLIELREKLLTITDAIDKRLREEIENSKKVLDELLKSDDIEESIKQNLEVIDDFFVQNLESELSLARKKGDLDRINKLEQVMVVIEKLSSNGESVKLLESMLSAESEDQIDMVIEGGKELITDEFLSFLNNVLAQSEGNPSQKEIYEKLRAIYRKVLKFSMKSNIEK